ncbi:MAG TPA: serine/threonine-protein kinase [Kofleriaceae bacterium]|nr:serine/threonine-protein kinase [Kofleriaceae bacterium]
MNRRDTGVTAVTSVTEVAAGKGPARGSMLLGKYRVESTLGFGGMGLVIKAHNIDLGQDVAIKILREDVQIDEENIARFIREAKNAVRLKSEHVARIRDVGMFDDGRPYMVMELLEGLDLGKLLLDTGRIEPVRAVDLVLQACDAIGEAHSLGIVHRDIKPTNLFVAKRPDGTDIIKVLDFGISKAAQHGTEMVLTQTQSMLGTPAYMSPEQMRSARTVDPRSDVWSIGCVLYEAVEGHAPFEASNFAELCVMVATEDPAPLVHAPELGGVLMRCLAKTLEERYQDIAELAADLAPLSSDPTSAANQVARIQRLLQNRADGTPPPWRKSDHRISEPSVPRMMVSSTPLPGAPSSVVDAAPPLDTVHDVRTGGGVLKTLAVLVLLFAVGIGAGLYVTRDRSSTDSQAIAPQDAELQVPATAPIDAAAAPEPPDAREITVEKGSNAAGSGSATPHVQPPPKQPPPKKPPPKKPPPKKPPPPPQGSGAGSATIVKPPPKCDPFDNKNGCS